ncbi:Hypothetical Protein FCC1311_089882 [Hondaea fermentalgiana]|uniref:Uncharacterized protein n=1 Tax=Hondaea fermentalgiana TaxID=2315210 RepID=A0A2R5GVS3_9STRA|nr:Hypothetical Protein FCC1311_089882 [Hondaea fermentalgiana]|eukprot:GBG32763.1 Hypothetical Protein FCC1311_089882 [Hondaea fermentalgiana]
MLEAGVEAVQVDGQQNRGTSDTAVAADAMPPKNEDVAVYVESNRQAARSIEDDTASTAFDATMEDGDLVVTPRVNSLKVDPEEAKSRLSISVEKPTLVDWFAVLAMSIVMGFIFGFAFAKSRVFEPMVIRGQFLFQNNIMMKMFLAAVATSQILFIIINRTPYKRRFERARRKRETGRGIRTTMLGAFILGMGLAVSAACPGMVLAQVGAGVENSGYTLLGGVLGALLFQLTDPLIKPITDRFGGQKLTIEYVDDYLGLSYTKTAGLFAFLITLTVILLEVFIPWKQDIYYQLSPNCSATAFWNCYAWPPFIGGVFVGLLQLPVFFVMGSVLGSSTSYVVACAGWLHLLPEDFRHPFTYAKRFMYPKLDTHWQLMFVMFSILGAYLTELRSGMVGTAQGLSIGYSLVGGLLLVFGARMAGGCTSGHGVSGMALLSIHSMAAVAAMFAGAIGTGLVLEFLVSTDSNPYYIAPNPMLN